MVCNIVFVYFVYLSPRCTILSKKLWVQIAQTVNGERLYTQSYITRQEAQLPQRNSASAAHMEGAKPSSPLPLPLRLHVYGRIRNPQQTYAKFVKRTLSWIGHSRSFKVILICAERNLERCIVVMSNMPPLFLKLTKIWQQEHSKFVDFNDPTQVWRRPSKKRLRISTNDLYCQKLESLAYIFAADSVGLHSLVFT